MTLSYKKPLSYYLGLLTSQYQTSSRFLAWAAAAWQIWDDISTCAASINQAYDLDSASGTQLDTLGAIIGASRTLPFQPTGSVSPVLTDSVYKILLQATLARFRWDGKTQSLYPIWNKIFPGGIIYINDNQNMTCTVIIAGIFSSIEKDLIVNGLIVPRPEGVLYTYSFATLPLFGADLDNAFIAGADVGHAA